MTRIGLSRSLLGILIYFVVDNVAYEAIVNGDKAGVDQFPYQVSVQYEQNQHFCGGGVIDAQFILTATHCVVKEDNSFEDKRMFVLAGSNDLRKTNKPAVIVEIHKIFVHVAYNPRNPSRVADIAVVKLKHPLELSEHIKKLNLPTHSKETYYGKTAQIAGFGRHSPQIRNERTDTQLRVVKADILEHMQHDHGIVKVPEFILHGKVKQHDHSKQSGVCQGDSGGPLVYNEIVVGVLSQSPASCSENIRGGLYTSVAFFLDFVKLALEETIHPDVRTHVVRH